jgi:hypothetical protein
MMNLDFDELNIFVDLHKTKVPKWFSGLAEFAYQVCSTRDVASGVTEHFVLSSPEISGTMTALSLGAIAAEVQRIEIGSKLRKIDLGDLREGMRVSLNCGATGQQNVTGEVTNLSLDSGTPKVMIGSRWIAAKLIQSISLIPSEAGNPQLFERRLASKGNSSNFLEKMTSTSVPIHRSLVDIRATNSVLDDELNWFFATEDSSSTYAVKDLIRPISARNRGSGWSLVLNSSESEELALSSLNSGLSRTELDSDITILCSGHTILSQFDQVDSKICLSTFSRDDRQLAATELAVKQRYEYSQTLSRDISFKALGNGFEVIAFEVPANV